MLKELIKKKSHISDFTEIDICEDEDQITNFEKILKMLINAGYYRARIIGLSNFDKIVGGMTWCIESCFFGIDIDLLFQENLTIGQKIAVTEKIVLMLPKMNCPYIIEPHQIQGLDYIHIFSVVQWLVQESAKTRKKMEEYVQSFAISQFRKKFMFNESLKQNYKFINTNLIENIQLIKEIYKPNRCFNKKNTILIDEFSFVSNVLLEYGESFQFSQNIINKSLENKINVLQDKEVTNKIIERKILEKVMIEKLKKRFFKFNYNEPYINSNFIKKVINIQAQEVTKAFKQYTTLFTTESENKLLPVTCAIVMLEKQKLSLKSKKQNMFHIKKEHYYRLTEIIELIKYMQEKKQIINQAFGKMKKIEFSEHNGMLKNLKQRIIILDRLRDQEKKFRDQCKIDLNSINNILNEIQEINFQEKIDTHGEYEIQKQIIKKLKLQLAKKNRNIATYIRQLDDIPERFELTQYQRRFMELYNQVSIKHKETKQYYTLYNTLDDKKIYLSKELTLLNSIQDNYNEAMTTNSTREQFIKQFELIIDEIQKNKAKIQKHCTEEKSRRDEHSFQLLTFVDKQRKYIAAVKQLTIECRQNEILLAQLREQ